MLFNGILFNDMRVEVSSFTKPLNGMQWSPHLISYLIYGVVLLVCNNGYLSTITRIIENGIPQIQVMAIMSRIFR